MSSPQQEGVSGVGSRADGDGLKAELAAERSLGRSPAPGLRQCRWRDCHLWVLGRNWSHRELAEPGPLQELLGGTVWVLGETRAGDTC